MHPPLVLAAAHLLTFTHAGILTSHPRFARADREWTMTDYFVLRRQWRDWMQARGMSDLTIEKYSGHVRNAIDALEKQPTEVTEPELMAYVNTIGGQGAHRNQAILACRSFWGYLSDKGYMAHNPASDLVAKKKKYASNHRCLSVEELQRVVLEADAFDRQRGLAIRLLYLTGIRVGSACKIKPADVDMATRILHVRVAKGDKPYDLPISTALYPVLKELLVRFDEERGPYLLGVKERTVWLWCKEAGDAAGIPKVHPHLMRHSYATHLLKNGADIDVVRQLMNHQSLAVTQGYVTTTMEEKAAGVELLSL